MAIKVCIDCKRELPTTAFNKCNERKDGLQNFCRECQSVRNKDRYLKNVANERRRGKEKTRRLKHEVVVHYGTKCVCCGETEIDFLCLDHIKGRGNEHRKIVGGGLNMYCWIKRNNFPDIFQVLCFNCNWSKHVNGQCVHKVQHVKN